MCGIAGFSLSDHDRATASARRMGRALLLGIEPRGHDASGFAFIDAGGGIQVHKKDETATRFLAQRRLAIPRRLSTAIFHTRAATQGSELFNENNHPIVQGTLVGVHNGMVWNDEWLWGEHVARERRRAKVDSEVIFAMLAHGYIDSGTTWTDALEAIQGSAAVAWLDRQTPNHLYLARVDYSPLVVIETTHGSVVFASTQDAALAGCEAGGLEPQAIRNIEEGKFLTVNRGDIADVRTFTPAPSSSYRTRNAYTWDWDDDEYGLQHKLGEQAAFSQGYKSAAESAKAFILEEPTKAAKVLGVREAADWWSPDWMSRDYFDIELEVPHLDNHEYFKEYGEREQRIDAWVNGFKGEYDELEAAAQKLHAFLRPGTPVFTTIAGVQVSAEVVQLPTTFPTGAYLLRCFVGKNQGTPDQRGTDVVLVERQFHEFTELAHTPPDDTAGNVTTLAATNRP